MTTSIPAGPDESHPRTVILTKPSKAGVSDVYLGEPTTDMSLRTNSQLAAEIADKTHNTARAIKVAEVDTVTNEIQFTVAPGDKRAENAIIDDVRFALRDKRRTR